MKPTLLVMAAGMGSRYGGLKQIDPVGPAGETIIDYSIFDAIRAGFGKVVFIIRRDIEADFREVFISKLEKHIEVDYVFQELDKLPVGFSVPEGRVKPWGTGHAILMAAEKIREPFAAINADDFYGAGAFQVMAQYLGSLTGKNQDEYAMVGYDLVNTMSEFGAVSRGICTRDADGWLSEVIERTKIQFTPQGIADIQENIDPLPLRKDEIVSMNFWGFTPDFFRKAEPSFAEFLKENGSNLKSEFYIPFVVDQMIKTKQAKVKVLQSHDRWFGVTYKEDKPLVVKKLVELMQEGTYPGKLWQ
ncbi:MAG: nucleotidyltransferase [Bacteroidetes bacterium]|nr:nucleotidyltransferase [Bacteroidota bacterium]